MEGSGIDKRRDCAEAIPALGNKPLPARRDNVMHQPARRKVSFI
jgi:hypothetical protein